MRDEEREERKWRDKERAHIREREHPPTQSPNMDCQGGSKRDYLALHLSDGRLWG